MRTIMMAANYSEFRTGLKRYLDEVEDNNDTLIIKRGTGKGTILISLEEYNSMTETIHLLSSRANADRLYESIRQIKEGTGMINKLIKETQRTPFEGRGQPEPLKYDFAGYWSRRIDREHRLVYQILDDQILIYSCRYHYEK